MFAQGDFNFHTRVGIVAEDFLDPPYGQRPLARLFQNFCDNDLAGLHG